MPIRPKLGRSDRNTTALFIGSQHEVSLDTPGGFMVANIRLACAKSSCIVPCLTRKVRVQ